MHHANMVSNVIVGLQKVLHQEKVLTENLAFIEEPVNHLGSVVQNTQQQLETQLQKIKAMIQAM